MMRRNFFAHIRSRVGRGLLLVLPLVITVWLLKILFNLINVNVTPMVVAMFNAIGSPDLNRWQSRVGFPVIGILLTVLLIYLLGLLAGNIIGKRMGAMVEAAILRVPIVKGIYGSARQLLDAFSFSGTQKFSKVILLEYPRRGLWTVGFVTTEQRHEMPAAVGENGRSVSVFLPTTPNPTSGWLLFVPVQDIKVLDISMEDAVKLVVSGGIVDPFGTALDGDGDGVAGGNYETFFSVVNPFKKVGPRPSLIAQRTDNQATLGSAVATSSACAAASTSFPKSSGIVGL